MANLKRSLFFILFAFGLVGCGTLQVGIEPNATSVPPATAFPTSTARAIGVTPTDTISTPTQVVSTPAPTPATGPSPSSAPVRINFPVGGTNFSFPTRLTKGVPERYILQVMAQQKMTITTSRNVTIEVLDAHGAPLTATSSTAGQWQGTMPQTADYIIVLRGDGFISVSIDIPPPG